MAKQHAPATLRNRDAIAQVLARELPAQGRVLEIASGTGEHAAFFAERFPALEWQPSDPSGEALASIAAYRVDYPGGNLAGPVLLDAVAPEGWPVAAAEAIVCINMVHISPWEATLGLFAGAARLLDRHGGPLILYGPYLEQAVDTAPSNLEFDASLRHAMAAGACARPRRLIGSRRRMAWPVARATDCRRTTSCWCIALEQKRLSQSLSCPRGRPT